jgi:hypothetical protein
MDLYRVNMERLMKIKHHSVMDEFTLNAAIDDQAASW